jgi:hypothetical protein
MCEIFVIPEAIYRKRTYRDETQRMSITAGQLVEVLNSCVEEDKGQIREFILVSE